MREKLVKIKTTGYDEFRDNIHTTELFDMLDCNLEVVASPLAPITEIDKIVQLVESMIHVLDVRITSAVDSEDYEIIIAPVQPFSNRRPR
jgi:hypothetical protein